MKIGIIGNYGATNVGDDAILAVLLKVLSGNEVTLFSARPDAWKKKPTGKIVPLFPLGIRSFFKYGFKNSIQALKDVELVIFGGGGLFQDKHLYACFLWAWQLYWVRKLNKPYFICATGVGPLKTKIGRWLTKNAYLGAEVITVRDPESAQLLQNLGIKKEIYITSDPVFLTQEGEKGEKRVIRTKNLFIISLRPWLKYNQKILQTFLDFLKNLKKERSAKFIFVSMQTIEEDDLQMIVPLIRVLGGKLYSPKNFLDLLKLMAKAEFAIGMRYHFIIAALLTHTPIIPLSYSPKIDALFSGSPFEQHLLPVENLTIETLQEHFKELSIGYNNAMVYEKALAQGFFDKAEENVERLEAFLETHGKKVDQKNLK